MLAMYWLLSVLCRRCLENKIRTAILRRLFITHAVLACGSGGPELLRQSEIFQGCIR